MELWDVYNKDRVKTDDTMVRGDEFKEGHFHLVVHACIFNNKGEMLIQQRQPFKKGWPNMWDISAGGSATKGDTSQIAMERELFEELGVHIDLQNTRPHLTINFDHGFDDVFLIEEEFELSKLTLQQEEVQQVKWASMKEILTMIDKGEFIPYYKELIGLFFRMRGGYGAQMREDENE